MKHRAILILAVMGAALVLSSGVALAALNTIECKTVRRCIGTVARDLMKGTDARNKMYGKGAGDILKGFGEWDLLYGGGGSDKLYGGAGTDDIFPGRGNDAVLDGGGSVDAYYFETNDWGDDTITDGDTGNRVLFLSSISTDLIIFLVSNPREHQVLNPAGSTVNWDGDVIEDVINYGTGDDTIYGDDAANTIISLQGVDNDTIYGGEGNEYIDVFDGGGGDYVNCGENARDRDFVRRDSGDRVVNCEDKNPL